MTGTTALIAARQAAGTIARAIRSLRHEPLDEIALAHEEVDGEAEVELIVKDDTSSLTLDATDAQELVSDGATVTIAKK